MGFAFDFFFGFIFGSLIFIALTYTCVCVEIGIVEFYTLLIFNFETQVTRCT